MNQFEKNFHVSKMKKESTCILSYCDQYLDHSQKQLLKKFILKN